MTTSNLIPVLPDTQAGALHTGIEANLPRQLWLRQIVIFVCVLLVGCTGYRAYFSYANIVQTIGKDSVPSIVAAEKIRTQLADAHTSMVNTFLAGENGDDGVNHVAYRKSIEQAYDSLVLASQNITYGDDERRPILAVLNQLSRYQQVVGMAEQARKAQGAHVDNAEVLQLLSDADVLMREQILPAVVGLDQTNFKHLEAAFNEDRQVAGHWLLALIGSALILAAALLEIQFRLYVNFHRILNLALVAGSALFVIGLLLFLGYAKGITSEIRTAREDAFDSVHALSKAKALAYSANAQESVYLLLHDQTAKEHQTTLFNAVAGQLYSGSIREIDHLPTDLKSLKGQGLLGDELANITFSGEEAKARRTLEGWLEYRQIDEQIRALEASGRHDAAIALCIGSKPHQSDWAFEKFMQALDATLDLNQVEFDAAISRALKDLRWLWMLLIPILLGPLLGSAIGLQIRLAEFRE